MIGELGLASGLAGGFFDFGGGWGLGRCMVEGAKVRIWSKEGEDWLC